jgi:hypothetical protein
MKHEARGKETGRRTGLPVSGLTAHAFRLTIRMCASGEEMHK